jgi:hypothetical protein
MQYQLKDYYTGKQAPPAQYEEIMERIDRMTIHAEHAEAEGKTVLAQSYRHSILILQGNLPPVRA